MGPSLHVDMRSIMRILKDIRAVSSLFRQIQEIRLEMEVIRERMRVTWFAKEVGFYKVRCGSSDKLISSVGQLLDPTGEEGWRGREASCRHCNHFSWPRETNDCQNHHWIVMI